MAKKAEELGRLVRAERGAAAAVAAAVAALEGIGRSCPDRSGKGRQSGR